MLLDQGGPMTAPHRYIENQIVKISRNTLNRMPLLVPDEKGVLAEEMHYIIAREAMRWQIVILAMCIHPFGYRAIIFDPKMQRSHFLKSINQCFSLAVKRRVDHEESLWSNHKPGNVPIMDIESLREEILEVCLDPIRRGFVSYLVEWELPHIGPSEWGHTLRFEDPRQDPDSPKKRSAEHNPGVLLNVNFATKIMGLKESLMVEISQFEERGKERQHSIFKKSQRYSVSAYLAIDRNKKRYFEKKKYYSKCLKRIEKLNATMKAFYLKYKEAMIDFEWDKWPVFPTGTLKVREYFRVPCEVEADEVFLFLA